MKSEQQEIIDYFINHNAYGAFRGNKIWQEMEKQKVYWTKISPKLIITESF